MTTMYDGPRYVTNTALAKLPLFATDLDIAKAIVGTVRAQHWVKFVLPAIEGKGFPAFDELHGGRPVPLVTRYFERVYWNMRSDVPNAAPDGPERLGEWRRPRRKGFTK